LKKRQDNPRTALRRKNLAENMLHAGQALFG
jgi:hypothetical protein